MTTSHTLTKGLMVVGNVLKNIVNGEDDMLNIDPSIVAQGKITRFMSSFIYVPNIVVDESLRYMDVSTYKNIIKKELTAFSGILIQAFRVMAEVYGASPAIIVNRMANPGKLGNYDDIRRVAGLIGREDYDYTYDLLEGKGHLPINIEIGVEGDVRGKHTEITNNTAIQKDVSIFLTTYEVQLTFKNKDDETRVAVIPITIYPNIIFTNVESLLNNVLDSDVGKTFFDRIDDYRAGVISFTDLIFATDLVKKYKENKIKNENDFAKYLNSMDKVSGVKDILYNSCY